MYSLLLISNPQLIFIHVYKHAYVHHVHIYLCMLYVMRASSILVNQNLFLIEAFLNLTLTCINCNILLSFYVHDQYIRYDQHAGVLLSTRSPPPPSSQEPGQFGKCYHISYQQHLTHVKHRRNVCIFSVSISVEVAFQTFCGTLGLSTVTFIWRG